MVEEYEGLVRQGQEGEKWPGGEEADGPRQVAADTPVILQQ